MPNMLVVEGGAMRSVFSAGLLDGFLRRGFDPFDGYIGVSAGAGNLAGFLAGGEGKSLELFLGMAGRRDFINPLRFLGGGHLLDLQCLFDAVAGAGLDIPAIYGHGRPLLVGATDVASGSPVYLETTADNLMDALMASMALPLMVRRLPVIDGRMMADGGMADAIPVQEAMRRGARRIMVVRSRPSGYVKRDSPVHRYIRWRIRRHPQLRRAMAGRVQRHAAIQSLLRSPPAGVQIVDVSPPATFRMGRFSTRRGQLMEGYRAGVAMAPHAIAEWEQGSSG